MTVHAPATEAELESLVGDLVARAVPFSVQGGNTRAGLGRIAQTAETVSTRALTGITLYEPSELVIGARAGTPVAEIEAALAAKRQMLPFEPMDHRALYATTGEPTIGGVLATNASGPARIIRGACRDSAIGLRVVNGRGQAVKSGGRVMKNVTGLDLVKLMCGSHGTLGVLSEVTFRVLPKAERVVTLEWRALDDTTGIQLLSAALGSPFEVMAAAHLPAGLAGSQARTLLRLENFSTSIDYRAAELARLFKAHGRPELIEGPSSSTLWTSIRDAALLSEPRDHAVWRVSTAPSRAAGFVAAIRAAQPACRAFYDWGGGLVWLSLAAIDDAGAAAIRSAVAVAGGHATLMRGPHELRAKLPVFQPMAEPLHRLTARIKSSFDPAGLIEPGRMYAGI